MYTIFLFVYLNTGKQTVVFSQWVIRTELLNNTTIVHGTVRSELSWKGVHWRFLCAFVNFLIPEHENAQCLTFSIFRLDLFFLNWTLNFLNRIEVNLVWNCNVNLQVELCGWKTHWLSFCCWNWHKFVDFVILIFPHVIQCWLNCIWFSLFVTENNLNSVYINILLVKSKVFVVFSHLY